MLVLDLLKYVLKNDGQVFTKLHGIAVETKLTPALATIYKEDLEESFTERRKLKPDLWIKYVDDVFTI